MGSDGGAWGAAAENGSRYGAYLDPRNRSEPATWTEEHGFRSDDLRVFSLEHHPQPPSPTCAEHQRKLVQRCVWANSRGSAPAITLIWYAECRR
jgi:hypothetical protein